MRRVMALIIATQLTFGCEIIPRLWELPSGADPLFRFEQRGKVGFIDTRGKVVVRPTLEDDVDGAFFDGMLSLGNSEGPFLKATGGKVAFKKFDRVWDFHEGLAAAQESFPNSKWGYVDRSGKWVISPRFNGPMSDFSDGFAIVEGDGKSGYIDHRGQFVIPAQFLEANEFSEGAARVVVSGPCFDFRGLCLIAPHFLPSGATPSKLEDTPHCRWSFIDRSGNRLFAGDFEEAQDFHEGLAAVQVDGKWGYVDKAGGFTIAPRFAQAASFSEGMAWVMDGESGGYIDKSGKMQFKAQSGGSFSGRRTFAGDLESGFVYVDKQGKQVIQERFEFATDFQHGLAHVKLSGDNDNFAYIDVTGKHVFTYRGRM